MKFETRQAVLLHVLVLLACVGGLSVGGSPGGRLRMPSSSSEQPRNSKRQQLVDLMTSIKPPSPDSPSSFVLENVARPMPTPSALLINWTAVPRDADPHTVTWRSHKPTESGGELTPRGRRKRAQVENFCQILEPLARAVAAVKKGTPSASRPLRVVDFGSGSGNLVLPLAVRFPHLTFVAVDDRPIALKLLAERAERMGLDNMEVWRGRIEAFPPTECDIAISLHACGSASDHAIEISLGAQAPYVVSPCCVGKINSLDAENPSWFLERPRSSWLKSQVDPTGNMYREIAVRADRSETKATKGQQQRSEDILLSRQCKALVELDRNQRAVEAGAYETALLTLRSMDSAYSKLDLLVGMPPSVARAVGASDGDAATCAIDALLTSLLAMPGKTQEDERLFAVSDEEWRSKLTVDQYSILRKGDTEPPYFSEETPGQLEHDLVQRFGSKYPAEGGYRCAGCNNLLYYARAKFGSRCGWPSFYAAVPGAVEELSVEESPRPGEDDSTGESGASKMEIRCGRCDGHLGHVFRGEGIRGIPADGARHCVNGLALTYDETPEQPDSIKPLLPYLTLGAIPP